MLQACQDWALKLHPSLDAGDGARNAAPGAGAHHAAVSASRREGDGGAASGAAARSALMRVAPAQALMRVLLVPVVPLGYSLAPAASTGASTSTSTSTNTSTSTSASTSASCSGGACLGSCPQAVLLEAAPEHLGDATKRQAVAAAAGSGPCAAPSRPRAPACRLWGEWSAPVSEAAPAPSIAQAWQLGGEGSSSLSQAARGKASDQASTGGALLVRPDGYVAWRYRGDACALLPGAPLLTQLNAILHGPRP